MTYRDEQHEEALADAQAERASEREAAVAILGEEAAYSLGVQDRIRGLGMRESFTLHNSDANHYVNGYRDMCADIGQREAFTSYNQHGFLDSEWQR